MPDTMNDCEFVETTITPTNFKLKIGTDISGSEGTLGCPITPMNTTYALGLREINIIFNNVLYKQQIDSIILALPLTFIVGCTMYKLDSSIVLGDIANIDEGIFDNSAPIVVDPITPSPPGVPSEINLSVGNGYLYIKFAKNRFILDTANQTITILFVKFALPLTVVSRSVTCPCICKEPVWYLGKSTIPESI